MHTTPSPDPSVPLAIEPVIGWRTWCIEERDGDLVLTSPMMPFSWNAREPSESRCDRRTGRGSSPQQACACGFYAVRDLHRLPSAMARLFDDKIAVVGSVALWGTVIEHATGYRAEFAYPSRLRLVCGRCFAAGWVGTPTRVERDELGRPRPVCELHANRGRVHPAGNAPADLEQRLLDTYAVDPLPLEVFLKAGFQPGPAAPAPLRAAVRHEVRQLFTTAPGRWALALIVAAILVVQGLGPSRLPRRQDAPSSIESRLAIEEAILRPPFTISPRHPGKPVPLVRLR